MKVIPETGAAPIISGNMETVNIGISEHAEDQLMILNVLSNTLYTDKIAAVLREYGCNAYDANVEAGRGEKPIEVRLPNRLDPTVAIRDFGLGMTEKQILETFCKLGRSTKRGSNAFTGMLGIGSKAGFAYGDAFTVTSYSEGVKTIYGCNRLQGVPKMSKMHQEPTDAPDGVEVKVPVRQADIAEFVTKAERIFRYFKVRPIFHGAKIAFDLHPAKFKGTNWRYTGSGNSVAIMGNVGYDLSADSLGTGSDVNYGSKVHTLIKAGIEVDFEIGDLEIAANREGLQYRDHTKAQIVRVCKQVVAEIGKVFSDGIANASCLWDATVLYGELFEKKGSQDYNISGIVSGNVVWKGHKVTKGDFFIGNKENDPNVRVTHYAKPDSYSMKLRRWDSPDKCHTRNTMLVINDLPSCANSPARMQGAIDADKNLQNIVVFAFKTPATQKKFWALRELDGAPTTNLSTITPAATVTSVPNGTGGPSVHRAKHQASAFVLDEQPLTAPHYGAARSLSWLKTTVNTKTGGGPYVVLDSFFVIQPGQPVKHNQSYDGRSLLAQIQQMRDAGLLTGQKVYGFKKGRADKLGAGWIPLAMFLQGEIATLMTKAGFAQELSNYIAAMAIETRWNESNKSEYPKGSLFYEFLDDIEGMRNPRLNKKLMAYIDSGKGEPWITRPKLLTPSVDLDTKEGDVLRKYPILGLQRIEDSRQAKPAQRAIIAEYVKLIEGI